MKLNQLISKPQLVKCVLDDEDIIKEFGEPIEWYILDRQPLERFLKYATSDDKNPGSQIIEMVKDMVLDENGNQIFIDQSTLPNNVLIRVVTKMTEMLGK